MSFGGCFPYLCSCFEILIPMFQWLEASFFSGLSIHPVPVSTVPQSRLEVIPFAFDTNIHSDSRVNWLDFGGLGSKVTGTSHHRYLTSRVRHLKTHLRESDLWTSRTSGTPKENFITSGTFIHLDSKIDWLECGGQGLKVTVTSHKHVFHHNSKNADFNRE